MSTEGDLLGISVHFSEVPDRVIPVDEWYVTIPLTRTERGGARGHGGDYYTAGSVKVYRDRGRYYVGFGFSASADDVVDPGESVLIGFDETNLPDGFVVGEPSTIEVTILDGPSTPAASTRVTLSLDPISVSEGAGETTVTVTGTLNGATRSSDTRVAVSVDSGTATAGTDFDTVSNFTLTILANERERHRDVQVDTHRRQRGRGRRDPDGEWHHGRTHRRLGHAGDHRQRHGVDEGHALGQP